VVVTGTTDVGVDDRGSLRGWLGGGLAIKIVVEDGFDGTIGAGANLEGSQASILDPLPAIGFDQPDDTQAGAKPCSG